MLFVDMAYCTLCDKYFPSADARISHVQISTNHPECKHCKIRFTNKNSLRTHWATSLRHNYCSVCERSFDTPAGLKVHVETASVHRDDSDDDESDSDEDEDENENEELPAGWEDAYGRLVYPEENERVAALAERSSEQRDFQEYWEEDELEDFEEFGESASQAPGGISVLVDIVRHEDAVEVLSAHLNDVVDGTANEKEENSVEGLKVTCPICLGPPVKSSVIPCGHLFCTSCIEKKLGQCSMCPVCEDPATASMLLPVHPWVL